MDKKKLYLEAINGMLVNMSVDNLRRVYRLVAHFDVKDGDA